MNKIKNKYFFPLKLCCQDLRTKYPNCLPIKNQGSCGKTKSFNFNPLFIKIKNCIFNFNFQGSCWAFAAVGN